MPENKKKIRGKKKGNRLKTCAQEFDFIVLVGKGRTSPAPLNVCVARPELLAFDTRIVMNNSMKSEVKGRKMTRARPLKPKISVVTINLNDASGLSRTLRSVRMQSYPNYEHILIDGASTDGSVEAWRQICGDDDRYRMVSEADGGIYQAMNKGLKLACGELIQILNSGDTLVEESVFQTVADTWESDPSWAWGFGKLCFLTPLGLPEVRQQTPDFNFSALRFGHSYVPHPSSFVSASLFEEYGFFNPVFGIAADQEFFLRISRRYRPYQWESTFVNFYMGGAHTQFGPWKRERMWHRMRRANNVLACNSNTIDVIVTELLALWRLAFAILKKLFIK